MENGNLYLIPNTIADNTQNAVIGPHIRDVLPGITHFLAEDIRTARRFLSSLKIYDSIESLHFEVLNKDTNPLELSNLLKPIYDGLHIGILSESGCPGIADPGAIAVRFAHENDIKVRPLVGPSSILLALMASGLNGQRFAFHGYLPIEAKDSARVIRDLEKESRLKSQTQIFIETPYRTNALFQLLLKTLSEETLLCIAANVTGDSEAIETFPVRRWKSIGKEWAKMPTVFLFLAI
jgi:16S rRNA (cytidine1402-2'-O)-methyltransferase